MGQSLSPDGSILATSSSADEMVRLWDARTGKSLEKTFPTGGACIAFDPKAVHIAIGTGPFRDGKFVVYEIDFFRIKVAVRFG